MTTLSAPPSPLHGPLLTQTLSCLIAALVAVLVVSALRSSHSATMRVSLLPDKVGNESLILRSSVNGVNLLFLLDTAYAGPPVLSTSYLSLLLERERRGTVRGALLPPSLEMEYRDITSSLRRDGNGKGGTHTVNKEEAVRHFMVRSGCRAYTSGCTMRLMGIGETAEAQADMLLCDNVNMGGASFSSSEVFVTHGLPYSVNILTMDFLLHRSPCILRPQRGTLSVSASVPNGEFSFLPSYFVGGAVRVPMEVGGAPLNIILDTGATASLSLSPSAVPRVRQCALPARDQNITQVGVNGEKVCSQAFFADVVLAGIHLPYVQVLSNSMEVDGADGYAGMGLLRAVNMCFDSTTVGFSLSGLPSKGSSSLSEGTCRNAILPSGCRP